MRWARGPDSRLRSGFASPPPRTFEHVLALARAVWRIRLQTLNIIPMARWMVRLGRYRNANTRKRGRGDVDVFESADYRQQVFENSKKTKQLHLCKMCKKIAGRPMTT